MIIRQMEIDDLDQVMQIENDTFSVPWTENGFFTFLIRNDTLFLVAEEETEIVGYAGMVMVPEDGDITNVAVKSSHRGKGTGEKIVSALIEEARKNGVFNIFLEVRSSNDPAIRLYEKLGFTREGIRKDYYELPREDAVIMKKTISAGS